MSIVKPGSMCITIMNRSNLYFIYSTVEMKKVQWLIINYEAKLQTPF